MSNLSQPGIIITQPGISVETAADYQMIFNSNWPSLQIAFEAVITVAAGSTGQVAHNLGFYPMVMTWFIVNNVSVGRFYAYTVFDDSNIYIDNSNNAVDVVASIKCYNVDITKEVNYALPKPPFINRQYDKTFGIKVSKNGKSIASEDMRDFILHSRCQSPAMLSVTTTETTKSGDTFSGKAIRYTNPAGYTPWVIGYATPNTSGDPTKYKIYPAGGNQSFPAFTQIGSTSYILGTTANDGSRTRGSIVSLRDPLVIPNSVRIQY